MDDVLVEFCRSGALGPLVLGSSPDDVVGQIGKPAKIKNGQGDDCFQWYRYSGLELVMRCFNLDAKVRRGAGKDLVLASIRMEFRGRQELTLPDAIAKAPIASAGALQLDDAHRLLAEHGVEMVRDHEQVLTRALDHAGVRIVSDDRGFVREASVHWRPPQAAGSTPRKTKRESGSPGIEAHFRAPSRTAGFDVATLSQYDVPTRQRNQYVSSAGSFVAQDPLRHLGDGSRPRALVLTAYRLVRVVVLNGVAIWGSQGRGKAPGLRRWDPYGRPGLADGSSIREHADH